MCAYDCSDLFTHFSACLPSAVCSTTIWMGHVAKSVLSEQVIQAFEDFGQVKSVDVSTYSETTLYMCVAFLGKKTNVVLLRISIALLCSYLCMNPPVKMGLICNV